MPSSSHIVLEINFPPCTSTKKHVKCKHSPVSSRSSVPNPIRRFDTPEISCSVLFRLDRSEVSHLVSHRIIEAPTLPLGRRTNLPQFVGKHSLPQASDVHAQECIRLRFYGCFQGNVGDSVEPRVFGVSHFCACLSQFLYCDGRSNLVIPPLQWDFAARLLRKERFTYPLPKHLCVGRLVMALPGSSVVT